MIIFFVLLSVAGIVAVGTTVARHVDGDRSTFLVAGRSMALPLVAVGRRGGSGATVEQAAPAEREPART